MTYYQQNREKCLAYQKNYNEENKDKYYSYQRNYYLDRKDTPEFKAYYTAYNKNRWRLQKIEKSKQRCIKRTKQLMIKMLKELLKKVPRYECLQSKPIAVPAEDLLPLKAELEIKAKQPECLQSKPIAAPAEIAPFAGFRTNAKGLFVLDW